ncbi:SDR family oxidoreductase [Hwanghaeella sp.]|uniref:SDR family oxidoreductase n=1 Tax=Hwanghaeella sp. TaxID=2605943 RepID=UPI003CCC3628
MANKLALVFGGSRGIGAAAVQKLAEQGFDVAFTYVSNPPDEQESTSGSKVVGYQVDITDPAQVVKVFSAVSNDFGSAPDCVVANAGINVPPGPVADFNNDNFRKLVEVNLVGAFNVLQHAARNVQEGGAIIGVTTTLVRFAAPGLGPYSATKAAFECLLRSMQKELAGRGIRVNGVAPGPVDTDLFRSGKDEAAVQRSAAMSPFNRVGKPEEVAEVIAFLASPKSSWVAGQIVQPNGGLV